MHLLVNAIKTPSIQACISFTMYILQQYLARLTQLTGMKKTSFWGIHPCGNSIVYGEFGDVRKFRLRAKNYG